MKRQPWPIVIVFIFFVVATIACSSPSENDQRVRTLAIPSAEAQSQGEGASEPIQVPPTDTPVPTAVPEIEGLVKEGTHLVGTDIQPGIFVGLAGEGILDSCYWARLSNLSGSNDIIANDNAEGQYYIEVLPDDKALKTACELLPIERVPARDGFLTVVPVGTYIVGRDIDAGVYRGVAGDDILKSCYWARLSSLSGAGDILANDNATGQFFVEVLATDFAVKFGCEVEKAQ